MLPNFILSSFFILGLSFYSNAILRHECSESPGATPLMGWRSWARYLCRSDFDHFPYRSVSEYLIEDQANALVKNGWRELGYQYVVLDGCFAVTRRANGEFVVDSKRFPSGLQALTTYLHSLDLYFGVWLHAEDFNPETYEPGVGVYDQQVAKQAALEWKVDYLSITGVANNTQEFNDLFGEFVKALKSYNPNILVECQWPPYWYHDKEEAKRLVSTCDTWWVAEDGIRDSWVDILNKIDIYESYQTIYRNVLEGTRNYLSLDQLIGGGYGTSYCQAQVQASLYAIFASDWWLSHDLRKKEPTDKIYRTMPLLDIVKDCGNNLGYLIWREGYVDVWVRELLPKIGGVSSYAIAFFNRFDRDEAEVVCIKLKDILCSCECEYAIFDVLNNYELVGTYSCESDLSVEIKPVCSRLFKAVPVGTGLGPHCPKCCDAVTTTTTTTTTTHLPPIIRHKYAPIRCPRSVGSKKKNVADFLSKINPSD